MAEKKQCTNCGQEIGEGAKFCSSCGSPVGGVQNSAAGENLVGIIPGVHRKKGLFGSETFNILVTDNRLVFALLTNDIIKEQAAQLKGQGFMARLQGAASGEYITRRYQDMPPEQALKESPGNFTITTSDVKKIKIKMGSANTGNVHDDDGKLEIQTNRDKLSFVLPAGSYPAAKTVLKNAGLA